MARYVMQFWLYWLETSLVLFAGLLVTFICKSIFKKLNELYASLFQFLIQGWYVLKINPFLMHIISTPTDHLILTMIPINNAFRIF